MNPLIFYPSYAFETIKKNVKYGLAILSAIRLFRKVSRDPRRTEYTDLAITPPEDDEHETLSLFQDTTGGGAAIARKLMADQVRTEIAAKKCLTPRKGILCVNLEQALANPSRGVAEQGGQACRINPVS
ncbi:MAG: hypothetical protein GY948_00465 [Alphaproteobacteria bacterium]|nr:hypothetical protein [Alphaproteobacteria bacterium]